MRLRSLFALSSAALMLAACEPTTPPTGDILEGDATSSVMMDASSSVDAMEASSSTDAAASSEAMMDKQM